MISPIIESLLKETAGIVNTHPIVIPEQFLDKSVSSFTIFSETGQTPTLDLSGSIQLIRSTIQVDIYSKTLYGCDTEYMKIYTNLFEKNNLVVGSSQIKAFYLTSMVDTFNTEFEMYIKTLTINLIVI